LPGYELAGVVRMVGDGILSGEYGPGEGIVVSGWPGGFQVKLVCSPLGLAEDVEEPVVLDPETPLALIQWWAKNA
jgi:hypothetical protein